MALQLMVTMASPAGGLAGGWPWRSTPSPCRFPGNKHIGLRQAYLFHQIKIFNILNMAHQVGEYSDKVLNSFAPGKDKALRITVLISSTLKAW
jgi:hypothetical protein